MTHKEFVEVQFKQGTEFKILFQDDHQPEWEEVKVLSITDKTCTLKFLQDKPMFEGILLEEEKAGTELSYTWDELSESNTDMMEIWV